MMRRLFGNERSCEISQMQMQVLLAKKKPLTNLAWQVTQTGPLSGRVQSLSSCVVRDGSPLLPRRVGKSLVTRANLDAVLLLRVYNADYVHGLASAWECRQVLVSNPCAGFPLFHSRLMMIQAICIVCGGHRQCNKPSVSPPPASSPKTTRILISLIDQSYRGGEGGVASKAPCLEYVKIIVVVDGG